IHITRHAGYVRDFGIIQMRLFRRLHVDSGSRIEHRATYAVPVEPAAKVSLGQTIRRDYVVNYHFGHVEACEAGSSSSESPLAHFLTKQGAGLATNAVIPQARLLEG